MEVLSLIILPFDVENTEDWRFQVLVMGEGFPVGASGLGARLGDEELRAISVNSTGTGFSGLLVSRPQNGSRLFVRSLGFDEVDTGIDFLSTNA
jgi:hypothetical protein